MRVTIQIRDTNDRGSKMGNNLLDGRCNSTDGIASISRMVRESKAKCKREYWYHSSMANSSASVHSFLHKRYTGKQRRIKRDSDNDISTDSIISNTNNSTYKGYSNVL